MDTTRARAQRTVWRLLSVATTGFLVAACAPADDTAGVGSGGSSVDCTPVPGSDRTAPVDIDRPMGDPSLEELYEASEAVVQGVVVDTESGLQLHPPDNEESTHFLVRVEESLTGSTGDFVDVYMPSHVLGAELSIPGRPLPDCDDSGVWFLLAADRLEGYVLTNSSGPLLARAGEAEVTGTEASSTLSKQVESLGGELDDVVRHLSTLSE